MAISKRGGGWESTLYTPAGAQEHKKGAAWPRGLIPCGNRGCTGWRGVPAPAHGICHLSPSAFQEGHRPCPERAGVEPLFASLLGAGQGVEQATLRSASVLRVPAPPRHPLRETLQDSFPRWALLRPSLGANQLIRAADLDLWGSRSAWRDCGRALGFIGP